MGSFDLLCLCDIQITVDDRILEMAMIHSHRVVLLLYLCSKLVKGQVTLSVSYESDTGTDVYQDEPLKVMCKADGVSADAFKMAFNFAKTGVVDNVISCLRGSNDGIGTVELGELLQALLIQAPTNEDCGSLPGEKLSVSLNATSQLSDYMVRCDYYTDLFGTGIGDPASELSMPQIKVAPQGLTMSITPESVQEGDEFVAVCESTGEASPRSSYEYEITRNGVVITRKAEGRYTPVKEDREGFAITCTDIVHTNWKSDNDIMKTKSLLPQYIDVGGDGVDAPAVSLNPEYNTNTLTCNIIAHTGAVISYTWSSSVEREKGVTTRVLTLDSRENVQESVTEVITCEGSVDGLTKTITWTITWNTHATTTQAPITSFPQESNKAGLYGGVGAAVAVLAIIIIVIAVVMWRKRKETHGGDKTTLQMTGGPLMTTNGEIARDTPLQTADYEKLQIPVSDGVYSQPDEHLYSGLMKRTQQTQPSAGVRDVVTIGSSTTAAGESINETSDYVNCNNLTTR